MVLARTFCIGLMAGSLLVAVSAASASKPPFRVVDKDNDGRITLEEAKESGVPPEKAEQNDVDDDGKLTEDDWKFISLDE